jgi:FKBP-type peptidyl-prolyl cis-trans isomerase SlyD
MAVATGAAGKSGTHGGRGRGRSRDRTERLKTGTGLLGGMSDQEAEEPEDDQADDEPDAGLQDGDFVRLSYTARTVEDGTLVDTTDQETAEEEGVDEEGREFEPRIVVLGAGHVFDPVEEAVEGEEAGASGTVTVPADDAFGAYEEDEVRTVSADKIPEDERYPGAHVEVDGQRGHVETIIGGRARVDFNHPLAGEDIEYDYEVVDVIEDRVEKAKGLLSTQVDADLEVSIDSEEVEEEQLVESDDDEDEESEPEYETVTVEKETLYIESTPQLSFNQQWMMGKQQIAQDIIDRLDLDQVVIRETIEAGGGMGMGGMMPGMGGGGGDLEEALDEADVDADELAEELDADLDEE